MSYESFLLVCTLTAYVFMIGLLALLLLVVRIRAVKSGGASIKYLRCFEGEHSDERIVVVANHFNNQFQLPVLFFIVSALYVALGRTDQVTLGLAWGFFAARLLHTAVHLGENHPLKRATVYSIGLALVLYLWMRLCYLMITPATG